MLQHQKIMIKIILNLFPLKKKKYSTQVVFIDAQKSGLTSLTQENNPPPLRNYLLMV